MMLEARQLGLDVVLIHVSTGDPAINVARVNNRVLLGGHDVPEEDIRRTYERGVANLPLAVARADHSLIFDNSSKCGFQAVAYFGKPQWLPELPAWLAILKTME